MSERAEEIGRWVKHCRAVMKKNHADPASLFGYALGACEDLLAALSQARREEREACIEAVRAAGRQVHETPRGPMTSIDVSALFYIDAIRARSQEEEL